MSKLPIEYDEANRKDLIIGESMNDVDMEKIIDLIEMTDKRVNLFIDNIDIQPILKRSVQIYGEI